MSEEAGVTLGPLMEGDSKKLFDWINDRELVHLNGPFRSIGSTHHRKWFDAVQERDDVAIFAIREKGGRLIGTCQLVNRNPVHQSADLQIRIGDTKDRGRGYGTAAVQSLLQFAFRDWNLHRVQLFVIEGNEAAMRTYEKCGFKREGVLRQAVHIDGQFRDLVVMAVLRDEV
ncbi:MAG TPA: UDP-4-amino-4,6-dideoxy-N-acetyl-beta-L-altrosamine N-acetyltransferase [Chloroflexi bacterium]|jgi:RimJ/RimL family protein N-acetyltransferase|nr:UDP-4-amino-4,6-dideoxy-N-acetyl-beta-L-altrosamine N-acetyltransferase [Chloroflexota bacterium]